MALGRRASVRRAKAPLGSLSLRGAVLATVVWALPVGAPVLAADAVSADTASDTWIFSGLLPATMETFSGTLVAGDSDTQFELRLGGGATCDGTQLQNDVVVVALREVTCSDGRRLRVRFVSEGGTELRVLGKLDNEDFAVDAYLLDLDAPFDAAGRRLWPRALPRVPHQPIASP